MMYNKREQIKDLLDGNLPAFYQEVNKYLSGDREKSNELRQKLQRLKRLKTAYKNRKITREQYQVDLANLEELLYDFVDELHIETHEHLSPEQSEGIKILSCLKRIKVQYEGKGYVKSSSKIKTYLIHSPRRFPKGLQWFWNVILMDQHKEFEYVSAKNNSVIYVRNILSELLGQELHFQDKATLISKKQISFFAHLLIKRLQLKPLNLVIDDALGLITLPRDDDEVDFINEIWKPIGDIVEKAHPTHELQLFLVQNEDIPKSSKHLFIQNYDEEEDLNKVPFLIEYHGLQHQANDELRLRDQNNLLDWLMDDLIEDYGYISDKRVGVSSDTKFINHFKISKSHYFDACKCGNIEKLFEEICNTLNYQFITHPPTSTMLWEVKPKNTTEEDTLGSV